MKYYVVSDTHGFYTETIKALKENGFFEDTEPHKLVLCGDMMDRGNEAVKMQEFMLDLLKKDELIYIRGNHEDLFCEFVDKVENIENPNLFYLQNNHQWTNRTVFTIMQLTGVKDEFAALCRPKEFAQKIKNTPFYSELIPASVNYFETEHYIFVHGWIPCGLRCVERKFLYKKNSKWRTASDNAWERARWINGIRAARDGAVEKNKTIVCGHYNASYGHSVIEQICSESGADAIHEPYYNDGIIAIDGWTAVSKTVNCLVLKD